MSRVDRCSGLMLVPMMQIRRMRMRVRERLVRMRVRMRLAPVPREIVGMSMMLVMLVQVIMGKRLVRVPMAVPLREMEPHAERDQR